MWELWAAALSLVPWSAAVPVGQDSVLDRYVRAMCLPASPLGSVNLETKSWDHTLTLRTGTTVHVTGAQMVGGRVLLSYPPSAQEYFPADSGDTVFPSEVRVDLTHDLLFVRISARPIFGWEAIPILFEFDLRKRKRVTDIAVDPAELLSVCSDKLSPSTSSTGHGSLFMLRRVIGGDAPSIDYTIEVDTDGTVYYYGRHEVCLRGKAVGHLSEEALEDVGRILRASQKIDNKTGRCRDGASESPGVVVEIRERASRWMLSSQGRCRPVEKLARALEATIGVERWTGTDEQRKRCH